MCRASWYLAGLSLLVACGGGPSTPGDAGERDAAIVVLDGAAPDTGPEPRDATPEDARSPDAFIGDAFTGDALAPDAVAPDAEVAADAVEPDAAPGAPDADPVDAQAPDADPVDAQAPDADPVDAQAPDADEPDAVAPDAEVLDAAAPDAMAVPPDATAPDATLPDADPLDASAPDALAADADPLDASAPDALAADADPIDAGFVAADAFSYDAEVPDLGLRDSGLPPIRFGLGTIQWPIQLSGGVGGDFDGNGRTDAVASTTTRTFAWFNDAAGWVRLEILAEPTDLHEAADMDLDGDLDLVVRRAGASIDWIENTGRNARPWPVHAIAPVATSLSVGDVTGDGLPDVATGSSTQLRLYARNTGVWVTHTVDATSRSYGAVAIADANLDGVADVTAVVSAPCVGPVQFGPCFTTSTMLVTRQAPPLLGFTPAPTINTGIYAPFMENLRLIQAPRLGQADTDPEPELYWTAEMAESPSGIHVLQFDATPTGWAMTSAMFYNDGTGTVGTLALGNFDTDLQSEIIWEGLGLFEGAFNTGLWNHPTAGGSFRTNGWGWPNAPVRRYHPADLDVDGLPDILVICDRGVFWLRYLP